MILGCKKCRTIGGLVLLALGALFLLVDFGFWDFWNVQWWTALFIVWGIGALGQVSCKDCCAIIEGRKK